LFIFHPANRWDASWQSQLSDRSCHLLRAVLQERAATCRNPVADRLRQQNRLQSSIICREPCSVISGLYMPCPDAERPLQLARIDGEAFLNRVRKSGCRLVHDGNEARKKRGCGKSVTPRIDWSGRQDLNLRHHAPKACALPGCATPRLRRFEVRGTRTEVQNRSSCLDPRSFINRLLNAFRLPPVAGAKT
jgi:hypothetical protein